MVETAGTTIPWYASVDELLARVTDRQPWKNSDSLSGSRFERVVVDGKPHIVKYLCVDDDWIMRATGDATCRQARMWQASVARRIPAVFDHTVAGGADHRFLGGRPGAVLLLRDVGNRFIPSGSEPLDLETELRFLDHMAELHAAFWGWTDTLGLMPMSHHYVILTPLMSKLEAARGGADPVPPLVAPGWARLRSSAPRIADVVLPLLTDPWPLIQAFEGTPRTLIHADWKLGNLGTHDDGRTILIDWDRTGEGPPCFDLAWYLAVNCDRLPHAKEDAIDAYRAGLERRGIATAGWWDRQLGIALIGAFLMLGWAKAGGDRQELAWWEERVLDATPLLP